MRKMRIPQIFTLIPHNSRGTNILPDTNKKRLHLWCNLSVTATGFKPVTGWSVVSYSIQLSYAANKLSNVSKKKSDRDRIQTCNRLIRSQLLYSVELRGQNFQTFQRKKSDRDRIQTCNRLIRSQLLYSVELRGHIFLFDGCKGMDFLWYIQILGQLFVNFFSPWIVNWIFAILM